VIERRGEAVRASIAEKLKESLLKMLLPVMDKTAVDGSIIYCARHRLRRVGCLRAAVNIAQC
jgi:hypothetical protein